ncbi:MAG: succinoglycan biosynthesis protein exoa [Crocinitomicaceae bacterium]|nr:succinoglycan biosynthesis protein exoa [Crocinitomicaceae bacterium]
MISVVIPCLNEVEFIGATLQSLINQEPPGVTWEVIVADGGSTDGTRSKLEEWSGKHAQIRWIDNPKRTTPHALNEGVFAARGEVVIILGAHAQVSRDWLLRNYQVLIAHPESGCVGGVVEQVHGSQTSQRIGSAMSTPFGVGDARFRTGGSAGHVDTVAFGAYRREALNEIGLFDAALTRNQDDELNYRLLKSGWRIWFDPRIRSQYHVRSTYRNLIRQYYQYGYWKVFVNQKHRTITTWRQTVPALFLLVTFVSGICWLAEATGHWDDMWGGFGASIFVSSLFLWLVLGVGSAIMSAASYRDVGGIIRAFAMIHAGYGVGYWKGIVDFIVFKRQPDTDLSELTR